MTDAAKESSIMRLWGAYATRAPADPSGEPAIGFRIQEKTRWGGYQHTRATFQQREFEKRPVALKTIAKVFDGSDHGSGSSAS
jgi:hypothetical protein